MKNAIPFLLLLPLVPMLASCEFMKEFGAGLTAVGVGVASVVSGGEVEVDPEGGSTMANIISLVTYIMTWLSGKFGWFGKGASLTKAAAVKTGSGTTRMLKAVLGSKPTPKSKDRR